MKTWFVVVFVLIFSCIFAAGTQPSGSGTSVAPYIVSELAHLLWISTNSDSWNKVFLQTADINASSTATWNSNAGWSPIGSLSNYFTGSYNGQGHTISGLTIARSSTDYIGLFGYVQNSTISNLAITSAIIVGKNYVGCLIGKSDNSQVSKCTSSGEVQSTNMSAGGLIGWNVNSSSSLSESYSNCNVYGGYYVGGLVGENSSSATISKCYATGDVTGSFDYAGGLIGNNYLSGVVENCYCLGDITRSGGTYWFFAGFIGKNDGIVRYCYSVGSVDAGGQTNKGFAGTGGGTFTSNFWDIVESNQTEDYYATAKTSTEMKTLSTFTEASWDFKGIGSEGIWNIGNGRNDDYPYLDWEYPDDPALPVTLTSFTTSYSKNNVVLNWITQSETDNLGFNLFRSESENGFENSLSLNSTLIPGMGTTSTPINYSYADEYPVIEGHTYFYWLQSVSTSNELELFGPVSIEIPVAGQLPTMTILNSNYPNPFNPETTIAFSVKENEIGELTIFNVRGERILKESFETGNHQYHWNATGLASGVYFYKLSSPTTNITRKMILMK